MNDDIEKLKRILIDTDLESTRQSIPKTSKRLETVIEILLRMLEKDK